MAYKHLQTLGTGNNNVLTVYNFVSDLKRGSNTIDPNAYTKYIKKFGVDFVPIIGNAKPAQGSSLRLFTFENGNYINAYFKYSRPNYTSSYSQLTGDLYEFNLDFYVGGSRVYRSNIISLWTKATHTGNGTVFTTHCYFSGAIDEENKVLYIACDFWQGQSGYFTVTHFPISGTSNQYSEANQYTFIGGEYEEYDSDPWANAGYAGIGGGEGTFDFTSDVIGLPDIPTINSVTTGFLQLYKGSINEIRDLASYMWTDSFITAIVKLTQDPMDIILGLYMYPFDVPASARKTVQAGNVKTTVSMGVPDSQVIEINCGDFPVPSFYGAYLDYEPFAKCELFLPYCGTQSISLDDVVGKTVNVRYRVDLLTGSCNAFVIVGGTVLYTFAGMCAVNIPITSRGFENAFSSVFNIITAGVSAVSAPAASAAMVAGTGANVAANIMQSKPSIARSGSVAANVGFMGVQVPYFIFTIPRVAIPKGQAKHEGYPLYATDKLSNFTGYTEVEEIHMTGFDRATEAEVTEIEKLLRGGIIL